LNPDEATIPDVTWDTVKTNMVTAKGGATPETLEINPPASAIV